MRHYIFPILAFIFTVCVCTPVLSQLDSNSSKILIGSILKARDDFDSQTFGYKFFRVKNKRGKLEIYEEGKGALNMMKGHTLYNSIAGKRFEVVGVEERTPHSILGRVYEYELREVNGQTPNLFYLGYEYSLISFELEIEEFKPSSLEDRIGCIEYKVEEDRFDKSKTTDTSPFPMGLGLVKVEKEGETIIYLTVGVYGETLNVGEKGVSLLLSNGDIYELTEKEVDVDANSLNNEADWIYSSFIKLKPEDIELFINNPIVSAKLYIYDKNFTALESLKFIADLNCLTKL